GRDDAGRKVHAGRARMPGGVRDGAGGVGERRAARGADAAEAGSDYRGVAEGPGRLQGSDHQLERGRALMTDAPAQGADTKARSKRMKLIAAALVVLLGGAAFGVAMWQSQRAYHLATVQPGVLFR